MFEGAPMYDVPGFDPAATLLSAPVTTVRVDLAAIRRARLELGGMVTAWLLLAGTVVTTTGCTGTAIERGQQVEFNQLPPTPDAPESYLFVVKLNLLNGDNPATEAMIARYLRQTMVSSDACVGRGWHIANRTDRLDDSNLFGVDLRRAQLHVVCDPGGPIS